MNQKVFGIGLINLLAIYLVFKLLDAFVGAAVVKWEIPGLKWLIS